MAPATTPIGAPTAAPVPRHVARAVHQGRLSWQITPMQTYFTNSNINPKAQQRADRLGWQLNYAVAPRVSIYWHRTPNDSIQETVGKKINNPSIDLIDEIGASYRLAPNWTVSGEYYYRWRQCCPGAGDPTNPNPAYEHAWSVLTNVAFGPNTIIGKPFSFTYQGLEFSHARTFASPASLVTPFNQTGTTNEGTKYVSSMTLGYRIPVFHQRKFVPFINVQQLPTYFTTQVEPVYSNAINYGANIVGSPLVTYTFSVRNLNSRHSGYPYAFPDTQHYTWLILAANFHGRLF